MSGVITEKRHHKLAGAQGYTKDEVANVKIKIDTKMKL